MSYLEMFRQAQAKLRAEAEGRNKGQEGHEASRLAEALPFLSMTLPEFQTTGACLEVRVPWLDGTLWLVPTEHDTSVLSLDGISRGRIWTTAELINLMAIADRSPAVVKTITHAKLELDGDVVSVRRHA